MNCPEINFHNIFRVEIKQSSRGKNFWTTFVLLDRTGEATGEVVVFSAMEGPVRLQLEPPK